jgi:hypothetical protein
MKEPLHEGINAYSTSYLLSRVSAIDDRELREFASELMLSVSDACFKYGAIDIGHIKAYIETDNGLLHADTLGKPMDVTVGGRETTPVNQFRLVLNSVIYGLLKESIRDATEEGLEMTCRNFGLEKRPDRLHSIPAQEIRRRNG